MNDMAFIEVQISGIWRQLSTVQNDSQFILHGMRAQQNSFPNNRIRAVDRNRRVLDIL